MANHITNGVFETNTATGSSQAPSGWTATTGSPDLQTDDAGFEWGDAGTWMPSDLDASAGAGYITMFSGASYDEAMQTTLGTSIVAGQSYTFTFDFYVNDVSSTANQGGATSLIVTVGTQVLTIPIDSTGATAPYWQSTSFTFTATDTTASFQISTSTDAGDLNQYTVIALDNLNLDVTPSDYIVSGTAGDDLIDVAYTGDPDGDRVDNNDAADGSNDDSIEAGAGNDTINAGVGSDTILAGDGNDSVFGGAGNDLVYGGAGGDTLGGGLGDDTLYGQADADRFAMDNGATGNDVFVGGETGNDNDYIQSSLTTDSTLDLTAGGTAGDNESGVLIGEGGTNTATFSEIESVNLGSGNDSIIGSDLADIVSGGAGADTFDGGAGDDEFDLGASDGDADFVVFADGDGNDSIANFEAPTDLGGGSYGGNDQLDVSGLTDASGNPATVDDVTVTDTNGDGTGDAILSFLGGETITLTGVPMSEVKTDAQLVAMGVPAFSGNYIVEGTSGDDLIDSAYTGDPEGDMIDNNDAADGGNDDYVKAGLGNDTVLSGDGNDSVLGDLGDDSIDSGVGDDTVRGGFGQDTILGGDGNDSLYGNEDGDSIEGGAGSDSIYGEFGNDYVSGGAGDDTVEGNEGNDTLYGGDGNDWMRGSYDNDELWGGAGDDYLWGGWGDDTFHIENGFGNDTVDAEGVAETNGDTLDLSLVTDNLTVDLTSVNPEEGSFTDGVSTAIFNEIEHIVLGAGDDTIILADGSGADTVSAFQAPTDLGGGTYAGNDKLDVSGLTSDGGTTPVTTDDVNVTDDGSGNAVLTFVGGEVITLLGVAPSALGDAHALAAIGIPLPGTDFIVSGTSGADLINTAYVGDPQGDLIDNNDHSDGSNDDSVVAGDGDDTIDAGVGNDTILGGAGDDEFFLDTSIQNDSIVGGETGENGAGDRINFSTVADDITITFSGDETGTLTDGTSTTSFLEIEEFQMGTGNDSVIGSSGAEDIIGNYGDDTILGGGGDDTIFSGFDNDSVVGGSGNDSIETSSGADIVEGGTGNDNIDLGAADGNVDLVIMSDSDGQDVVSSFEVPTDLGGGSYAGNDQLDVSGLTDASGNPVTVEDVTVTDTDGDGTGDAILTFPGGESITLAGVAIGDVQDNAQLIAMGIPASVGDYIVEGTAAGDLIDTGYVGDPEGDMVDNNDHSDGSNADSIVAGAGNDTVFGGNDNDTIQGNTGDDSLYGESGNDSLVGGAGSDAVFGGVGNDTLSGDDGADTLHGGTGDDFLAGRADADTAVLESGFGTDTIVGGEAVSTGTDNDSIDAGALTANTTVAFTGDEAGTLSDGTDTATFSEIEGIALGTGNDTVDASLSNAPVEVWLGAGNDSFVGGAGNDTVFGFDDNDSLLGGAGNDSLDGDAGADTIDGGIGDDTLVGDQGNDSLTGGAGLDEIYAGLGDDTITMGEGDSVYGGEGDDLFVVEATGDAGTNNATVVGGEANETLGDTLDFQGLTHWDNITYTNTDPGVGGGMSGSATLADGSVVTFSEIENVIICFTTDTHIATANGLRKVQDLRPGDMVVTRDHGLQPIRWTGNRTVPAQGNLAPIRFQAGTVGNDLDLLVSPQHRMLIHSAEANLFFGESEVLASAKHMVNGGSIARAPGGDVAYFHIMFDQHEIVFAEGAPSESFFPGGTGLDAVQEAAREELFTLFPELRTTAGSYGDTARLCVRAHEARLLRLG